MKKFYGAVFFAVASIAVSACDSGPGAASSAPAGSTTGGSTSGGGPTGGGTSNVPVGESCQGGDANHVCLAVHFVTYKDPSGIPVVNETLAAAIIHGMNQIWKQCDVGFQIEKYEQVDPTQFQLSYGSQSENELTQIRQTWANPNNELLGVTTGPWGTNTTAWTAMPGTGPYGAVMSADISNYGNGVTYAHEFGHYIGLDHVSDPANLMNPVTYTTSVALDSSQCQTAVDTAKSFWPAMLRQ